MLRKTFASLLLTTLFAEPTFAGFYAGIAAGPEGAYFSQKSRVTRLGTFDVIDKEHFAGIGGFGSLFVGYGQQYNQYYLALEANANLSSVKYQLTNDEYIHQTFSKTTFRIRNSEGISLLPGYFLTNKTLAYARIGYINGRLKIVDADPTVGNFKKNLNGIRYGLGLKHDLTSKLALRMDYSQVNYGRVRGVVFEPFGMVSKATRISSHTAQVAFGLIYNFDEPQVYTK